MAATAVLSDPDAAQTWRIMMSGTFRTADATVSIHSAAPVTPDNAVTFPASRALWIGTAGDLTVDMAGSGEQVLFPNLTVGWHPLQVTRVYAAGTAAAGIVRGW